VYAHNARQLCLESGDAVANKLEHSLCDHEFMIRFSIVYDHGSQQEDPIVSTCVDTVHQSQRKMAFHLYFARGLVRVSCIVVGLYRVS